MSKRNILLISTSIIVALLVIAMVINRNNTYKKIDYEYDPIPITEIEQVRECIAKVTNTEDFDIEEVLKDQILLSDVYRYCLKTVEDIEAVLFELAK